MKWLLCASRGLQKRTDQTLEMAILQPVKSETIKLRDPSPASPETQWYGTVVCTLSIFALPSMKHRTDKLHARATRMGRVVGRPLPVDIRRRAAMNRVVPYSLSGPHLSDALAREGSSSSTYTFT